MLIDLLSWKLIVNKTSRVNKWARKRSCCYSNIDDLKQIHRNTSINSLAVDGRCEGVSVDVRKIGIHDSRKV